MPISEWLKCAKIEASQAAIRAQIDGLPDCWWVGRDIPTIGRKSRISHWELMGPSSFTIIPAKDIIF